MTIYCHSLDELLDVVAGLVARGLGFRTDVAKLQVELTGAH